MRAWLWTCVLLGLAKAGLVGHPLYLWTMRRALAADPDPWLEETLSEAELEALRAAEHDKGEPW